MLLSPAASRFSAGWPPVPLNSPASRFGRTIQIYAPLYLSSFCTNRCAYCGFSAENKIDRRVLTMAEAEAEAAILHARGFSHILLVSGEAPARSGVDYLEELARRLRARFAALSIEVQPLSEENTGSFTGPVLPRWRSIRRPMTGTSIPRCTWPGKRLISTTGWRLRPGWRPPGMREVGIGALLGLRTGGLEGLALGHASGLAAEDISGAPVSPSPFPGCGRRQAVSPRWSRWGSESLSQLIFALRIFDPDVGLLLSTREEARFRDGMIGLGPTRYSAGSCTAPGGYGHPEAGGRAV